MQHALYIANKKRILSGNMWADNGSFENTV